MTVVPRTSAPPGQWRRHPAIVLGGMKAHHIQRPPLPPAADQFDSDLREWNCPVLRNSSSLP